MTRTLAVLICTHNRAALLRRAIASLQAARRPCGWQVKILVVANACSDSTHALLAAEQETAIADPARLPLDWFTEPRPGKAFALNAAIPHLRSSDMVTFVDDDHRVDASYLAEICRAAEAYPHITMFCGRILPEWDGTEPRWVHDDGPYRIRPLPILVLSAFGGKESERAAEALAAGALETMSKTELSLRDPDSIWATALRGRVKRLASVRLRRAPARPPGPRPGPPAAFPARPARAVGIGASTGGPPALLEVLRELPADFQAPVFVVQHIAAGFLEGLVSWLEDRIPLPVRIATAGARVEPGVWFAPDHVHLLLEGSFRMATDATAHGAHRPSIDVLFRSLAATHAEGAVGVVLTGMGSDGAAGVKAIRAAGGYVVAQDEPTSAVFGMPRSAIEAGADAVLPVAEIGRALCSLRTEAPR